MTGNLKIQSSKNPNNITAATKVIKTNPDRNCPWCGKGIGHCMVSKMPCDVKNCGIQYLIKKEVVKNAVRKGERPKSEKVKQEGKEG